MEAVHIEPGWKLGRLPGLVFLVVSLSPDNDDVNQFHDLIEAQAATERVTALTTVTNPIGPLRADVELVLKRMNRLKRLHPALLGQGFDLEWALPSIIFSAVAVSFWWVPFYGWVFWTIPALAINWIATQTMFANLNRPEVTVGEAAK